MTIRNSEHFLSQIWDWGFLDDCFGKTKIKVSDIEGIVERHGNFLVIECKSHNASVPKGQQIMHDNMVKTGLFIVLLIWGEPNKPERLQILWNSAGQIKQKKISPASLNDIHDLVCRWFNYADTRSFS